MLRIHTEQIEWFARKSQADFVGRMASYLREHFAGYIGGIADLEGWIRRVIERSLRFGVTRESEVAQLMLLFLVADPEDAANASWMEPILRDRALLPVGKARKLVAEARARDVVHVDQIDITDTLEGG